MRENVTLKLRAPLRCLSSEIRGDLDEQVIIEEEREIGEEDAQVEEQRALDRSLQKKLECRMEIRGLPLIRPEDLESEVKDLLASVGVRVDGVESIF